MSYGLTLTWTNGRGWRRSTPGMVDEIVTKNRDGSTVSPEDAFSRLSHLVAILLDELPPDAAEEALHSAGDLGEWHVEEGA